LKENHKKKNKIKKKTKKIQLKKKKGNQVNFSEPLKFYLILKTCDLLNNGPEFNQKA
jgi:hypothetical protein